MSIKKQEIGILHTAFVGDLVLLGLLIEALFQNGINPILITNKAGAMIYSDDQRIKKIVIISKKKGLGKVFVFYKNILILRRLNLSVLLTAHRSIHSLLLTLLSGSNVKIGFEGPLPSFRRVLLDECHSYKTNVHERVRLLSLAKSLITNEQLSSWEEFLGPTLRQPLKPLGDLYNLLENKKFLVFSPGSVWPTKVFPPRLMAEVAVTILNQNNDFYILVNGGPNDKNYIEEFFSHPQLHNFSQRVINAFGKLPLSGLLYLAPKATAFLCNDSAPMHIASAFLRPVVAIFGPTASDTGFGPTSPQKVIIDYQMCFGKRLSCQPCSSHGSFSCPLGHHMCMKSLPVEVVLRHLLPFVNNAT